MHLVTYYHLENKSNNPVVKRGCKIFFALYCVFYISLLSSYNPQL